VLGEAAAFEMSRRREAEKLKEKMSVSKKLRVCAFGC